MVTEEEVKQLAAMINWAMEQDDIQSLRIDCFKQAHSKTKEVSKMAAISMLKSGPKNLMIIGEESDTLLGAMGKLSKRI